MIGGFTEPKEAKAGPKSSKELLNNHRTCINELQKEVAAIAPPDLLVGEDTTFYGIKDAQLVTYIIKATLSDVIIN